MRPLSNSARCPASPSNKNNDPGDFYSLLLSQPLPTGAARQRQLNVPSKPPSSAATTPDVTSGSPTSDVAARARLVFGSSESTPDKRFRRHKERDAQASVVAGVRIPPRPSEPDDDDCCMSGCVNCVWDLYREELEEWAALKQEAEMKLHGRDATSKGRQMVTGGGMADGGISVDDDGGGSETNWNAEDARLPKGKGLFDTVPVGIREFMMVEKRLGQKRREREAAMAKHSA